MYSNIPSVEYLVAILKKKHITEIVISPGNSHNAIVRSIEEDGSFNTYNIVDERSAAFFAIGLVQEKQTPVALCCTSGTAVSNYLSGVTEAFRRNLPLVVITGDKNPYYLNQYQDQMIDQTDIFSKVTRYHCTLPMIKDEDDRWYCKRILNEAMLSLSHHSTGPVHINVPIEAGIYATGSSFTTEELPSISLIERCDIRTQDSEYESIFKALAGKKVLLICGQDDHIPQEELNLIESISSKYNCVFATDKLSNLHCKGTVEVTRAYFRNRARFDELLPEVIISLAGNPAMELKKYLPRKFKAEHWIVNDDGRVADPFRKLNRVFELSTLEFLRKMDLLAPKAESAQNTYLKLWLDETEQVSLPEFEFSNLYATQRVMQSLPAQSVLNLGNSTTIRIAQFFDLDPSIEVYCNRGVNGIDGCMSAFIGQSAATDKLSFLILGDLTFFYDMNAIWNRYVGKNVRIVLLNNEGAALFHFNQGLKKFPTLNQNVAAEHFATAKGWTESMGLNYFSASSKEEFEKNLQDFINPNSDRPAIFEVFTKKETDAKLQHEFYDSIAAKDAGSLAKKAIKSVLGEGLIKKLKK
jgi:2-succinyl-5-enolpyruvyl-6-hydroxy-3-cyclohexene-1-carboxylate synthase